MNKRVREVREALGLSMASFGAKIGVTSGAVSMMENGQRNISTRAIKSICNAFGVNETWLLTGEGEPFAPKTRAQEIAEIVAEDFAGTDEEDEEFREELLGIIQDMRASELRILKRMAEKMAGKAKK